MKQLLILFLSLIISISYSQEAYKRQQSAGEIPDDLRLSIQEKIKLDKQEMEGENNSLSKVENKFLENTNRNIDQLLQSGKILFGDEMTLYINKLAKLILEKNNRPELIGKLRFYTVKSSVVNAFATHQGMLFVNVGLLAQVENESQLAFIISHEIAHYLQDHVLESHLNKLEYVKNKNDIQYDDVVKELSSFSKKQEFESDSIGYLMYTKAGYNPEDAEKAMNVLQYAHLPFDEIKMENDFFNKDSYQLNLENYFTDELMNYKDISDKDDSRASHPNIKKRKENMKRMASFESKFNLKKEYLLSKEEFKKIQKIARLDNLKNNLTSRNYIKVVYESYLLKRTMPNETYIDNCLAKALYAISKLKTYDNFYEVFASADFEGEISKVFHLFSEQLSDYEINIMALKQFVALNNEKNKRYEDDLIYDLVHKLNFDIEKFHKTKPIEVVEKNEKQTEQFKKLDSLELAELTKIDRILYFQKLKKLEEGQVVVEKKDEYYLNAFLTEMNDPQFVSRFEVEKREELITEEKDFLSLFNKKEQEAKEPIDGLIIVDPVLVSSSDKKGINQKVSEEKSNELQQVIGEVATSMDLDYVISSREGNTENLLANYNGEAALKEWLFQYTTYHKYKIKPLNVSELEVYTSSNNASYVVLSAIYTNRGTPVYGMVYTTLCTLTLYPVLPFMIFENLSPRYKNYIYTQVVNTKTDEMILNEMSMTNKRLREYNIRSILYYNLMQLK